MIEERIDFLVITEDFLRPGDPPQGLFRSTYDSPGSSGKREARRGILFSIHPDRGEGTERASHLGGGNPNILWIVTSHGNSDTFAAGVYWPDNRKLKEADEVRRQLQDDIDKIPLDAHIIILETSMRILSQRKELTKLHCQRSSPVRVCPWSFAQMNRVLPVVQVGRGPHRTSTTSSFRPHSVRIYARIISTTVARRATTR